MDNPTFTHISNLSVLANNSASDTNTSSRIYSEENHSPTRIITQPTVNKLSSEAIKQEELENTSVNDDYSVDHRPKPTANRLAPISAGVPSIHLNPSETVNGQRFVPMTNVGSHLISNLNPIHLSDGTGPYFVPALADLASNYKLPPSSNSDLPSPSSSSNSSNPPSSTQQHSTRRHGEGGDPTRKRQMRLQKNREAARECRRKKKEYIKCLEERVNGLENQNKALIEELRQLKELYCQRDETSHKNSNNKTTTVTTSTR